MPKIPLYEQGRLASSLVGTPGVDNSGQVMAETVSSGLSQLNTALAYKQRQTLAAQKELETLQRNAIAAERVSAYDVKANQGYNDVTEKNAFTPDIAMAELPKHLKSLGASAMEGVEDPQTKMLIQQKVMEKEAAYIKQASDWKTGRSIPIAEKSLEAQVGDLSQRVRSAVGPDGVVDSAIIAKQFQEFDASTSGLSSMLYGPAAGERNRQAKGAALKDVLFDMAAKGPQGTEDDERFAEYLKKVYESPEFQSYMNPEDGKQVLVEARRIAAEASRAKREEQITVEREAFKVTSDTINAEIVGGVITPNTYFQASKNPNLTPAQSSALVARGNALRKEQAGEGKKVTVQQIQQETLNELTVAEKAYEKYAAKSATVPGTVKPSKVASPYQRGDEVKRYEDHAAALQAMYVARQAYASNVPKLIAAGKVVPPTNTELERRIAALEAEGSGVTKAAQLAVRRDQRKEFIKATPVPRFSSSPAEQLRKTEQFNMLRDKYFTKVGEKYKGDTNAMFNAVYGMNPKTGNPMINDINKMLYLQVSKGQ